MATQLRAFWGRRTRDKVLRISVCLSLTLLLACTTGCPTDPGPGPGPDPGPDLGTWNLLYGSDTKKEDVRIVQQTSDGGYMAAGSDRFTYEGWLLKTDRNGNELRMRYFSNPFPSIDFGPVQSADETFDKGFILSGSGLRLLKTDSLGRAEWVRDLLEDSVPTIDSSYVRETFDRGYIVSGTTRFATTPNDLIYNFPHSLLIKTNANGVETWSLVGEPGTAASHVEQTPDGGYIVVGVEGLLPYGGTEPTANREPHVWVAKLQANGDESWRKVFSDFLGGADALFQLFIDGRVLPTSDGGYVVTGHQFNWAGPTIFEIQQDAWVAKLDATGEEVWSRTFGTEGVLDTAYEVVECSGGCVVVTGASNSSQWLMKLDELGSPIWTRDLEDYGGLFGLSLDSTSDGGYVVATTVPIQLEEEVSSDVLLIKMDSEGFVD